VDKREELMYDRKELFGYRRKFSQLFINNLLKKIVENFTQIITSF